MVKLTLLFILAIVTSTGFAQQVNESETSTNDTADEVCSDVTEASDQIDSEFDSPAQRQPQDDEMFSPGILSTAPPSDLKIPEAVWSAGGHLPMPSRITSKPFRWTAPGVVHRELIFEEPLLERHGYNHGHLVQPVVSGTRFFWRSTFLPLTLLKGHHRCCDSGLGWGVPNADPCPACYR